MELKAITKWCIMYIIFFSIFYYLFRYKWNIIASTTYFIGKNIFRIKALRGCQDYAGMKFDLIPSHFKYLPVQDLDISKNELFSLDENIFFMMKHSLKKINLSDNNFTKIPEVIMKMKNLEQLNMKNNKIEKFPWDTHYLTNIRILDLSHNKLSFYFYSDSDDFYELRNLVELSLNNNEIESIPDSVYSLKKLKYLYLDSNKIIKISEKIKNLKELSTLSVSKNKISYFPNEIYELTKLENFKIDNNPLESLPKNITNLKNTTITINQNKSHLVPTNIKTNIVEDILVESEKKKKNNSDLSSLSSEIRSSSTKDSERDLTKKVKKRIKEFRMKTKLQNYRNNNLIYNPPPINPLFFRQDGNNNPPIPRRYGLYDIYNDVENVHNTNIQASVRTSIENIMKDEIDDYDYIDEVIKSEYLSNEAKIILIVANENSMYATQNFTFGQLLKYVLKRITTHENKEDLFKILNDEMIRVKNLCFTGKLSALVSVLDGYCDDVKINIDKKDQIGTWVSLIRNKLIEEHGENYSIDEFKEKATKKLEENNVEKEVIDEWIINL
jgi:Leucine-rich repeat (LRR) protein